MHYGVVDARGKLAHYVPIPLPGPRLPHDMCYSEHYAILNDFPVFWNPKLLEKNIHAVRLDRNLPSRFAIIPRRGGVEDIRWFEAKSTYVLHWLNAFEEGDEIILDGYFEEDPSPAPLPNAPAGYEQMMAFLDQSSFKPRLHRWRFNLKTGKTHEEHLDDRLLEFGTINQKYAARRHRYIYSTMTVPGWFLFDTFVKNDLETGKSWAVKLDQGRFGSEPVFAPRINPKAEDDGYLVSFIIDENAGTSECVLIDAANFDAGPVCRIALPHKICSGTHAWWTDQPKRSSPR